MAKIQDRDLIVSLNDAITVQKTRQIECWKRPSRFISISDAAKASASALPINEANADDIDASSHPFLTKVPAKTSTATLVGTSRSVVTVAFKLSASEGAFTFVPQSQKTNKVSSSQEDIPAVASPNSVSANIKDKNFRAILVSLKSTCRFHTLAHLLFMAADSAISPINTLFGVYGAGNKGTLEEVLMQLRFPLNAAIKASMCRDLVAALAFLHSGAGEKDAKKILNLSHGAVTPRTLFVDAGWRLKLGGFGGGVGSRIWSDDLTERLFIAPEHIRSDGDTIGASLPGDVYSAAIVINMIFCDGEWPFANAIDDRSLESLISELQSDTASGLRPSVGPCKDEIKRMITQSWAYNPSTRPTSSDILSTITRLHPFLATTYPIGDDTTGALLSDLFSDDAIAYAGLLSSWQHRLESKQKEDAVAARVRIEEDRAKMADERESLKSTADRLRADMKRANDFAEKQAASLRNALIDLKKEVINARHGLLPRPLIETILTTSQSAWGDPSLFAGASSISSSPFVDMIFQPTVYESVTILVVSVSGFNRHIQQLSTAPRLLADLLQAYYKALEAAIEDATNASTLGSTEKEFGSRDRIATIGNTNGRTRVHIVERIADACILVGGAPDRNETNAEDLVEVAVKLMEWSNKFDASSILGGSRINLRVGIHTGPVTAAIIGHMPKFLLMGETVNLTSGIESLCSVQEIRVSAVTQALLQSKGYRFEQRQDIDLRSRGRMGTFTLVATPRGPVSGHGAVNAVNVGMTSPSLAANFADFPLKY